MDKMDQLLEQVEQDPEVQAIKANLTRLEHEIKGRVADDVWQLLLDWEAEWAAYATVCARKMCALACREGRQEEMGRE